MGGAVGSLSGQIAKELGATVIGVAGKPEKLDYMKSLGFDHVFNYKTDDLKAEFKRVAPKGITHYFDNTAGPITEAFLQNAATGAKHAVCGAISDYNKEKPDGIRSWPRSSRAASPSLASWSLITLTSMASLFNGPSLWSMPACSSGAWICARVDPASMLTRPPIFSPASIQARCCSSLTSFPSKVRERTRGASRGQ